MVRSMTGFGRGNNILNGREISIEIKSVNHRYFEFSCRMPRSLSFLEDKIKAYVNSHISRGKVEVSLSVYDRETTDTLVTANLPLARSYYEAVKAVAAELSLPNDASAFTIAHMPDVITAIREDMNEEAIWADVSTVLSEAVESFVAMREKEGERLCEDIMSRLAAIENTVGSIEELSAPRLEIYREKLYAKMQSVLEDTNIDETRILLEAAVYADRTAIDEESVRLRSHISQYRDILSGNEPVGRKLDFLTQELNREINTIGSKANDLDITGHVVDIKAEIEKIREQIQNME